MDVCGVMQLARRGGCGLVLASAFACEPQFLPLAARPSNEAEGPQARTDWFPSNPTYATDPTTGGVVGDESTRLLERVLLRVLTEQRAEAPQRDGRLAVIAAWAASKSAQTQLSSAELDEVARRAGHVGPSPAGGPMQGGNLTEAAGRPLYDKADGTFPPDP